MVTFRHDLGRTSLQAASTVIFAFIWSVIGDGGNAHAQAPDGKAPVRIIPSLGHQPQSVALSPDGRLGLSMRPSRG